MKLKSIKLIFLLVAFSVFVLGSSISYAAYAGKQVWLNRLDLGASEQSSAAATDSDGNIFVAGQQGSSKIVIVKYDGKGKQIWIRQFTATVNFWRGVIGIAIDKHNNVFVHGAYELAKFDNNGNMQWTVSQAGGIQDIGVDNDGNAYASGQHIAKYAPDGQELWSDFVNVPEKSMTVDSVHNLIVIANKSGNIETYDFDGNHRWSQVFLNAGGADPQTAKDTSGNIYLASSNNNGEIIATKFDHLGNLLWTRSHSSQSAYLNEPYAIEVDRDANVYIVGSSYYDGTTDSDYVTLKYSPQGNLLWTRLYDHDNSETTDGRWEGAYAVAVDDTGNVYVTGDAAGWDASFGGYDLIATIKYDSNGTQKWVQDYHGPDFNWSAGMDVVLGSDRIFVVGTSYASLSGEDMLAIGYAP